MELKYSVNGNEVHVNLAGEFDTPSTLEVQPIFQELLEHASKNITIDCTKLEYIASSGLRQFITLYKKCQAAGGHMTLTNVTPDVMEIFAVTNFDNVFDIK